MFIFRLEIGVNDERTLEEIALLCVTGRKLVLIYDNSSKVLIILCLQIRVFFFGSSG